MLIAGCTWHRIPARSTLVAAAINNDAGWTCDGGMMACLRLPNDDCMMDAVVGNDAHNDNDGR